jgi:prepilin peptidase CpaA
MLTMMTPASLFAALFIFLIAYTVVSDMTRLVIPNWASIALVMLFFGFLPFSNRSLPVGDHVLVALAVFAGCFVLYVRRWLAGGDVKLLAAVALWAGPDHILELLFLTSLCGLGLALAVRASQIYLKWFPAGGPAPALMRLIPKWARHGLCPYGMAIGVAALAIVPADFF